MARVIFVDFGIFENIFYFSTLIVPNFEPKNAERIEILGAKGGKLFVEIEPLIFGYQSQLRLVVFDRGVEGFVFCRRDVGRVGDDDVGLLPFERGKEVPLPDLDFDLVQLGILGRHLERLLADVGQNHFYLRKLLLEGNPDAARAGADVPKGAIIKIFLYYFAGNHLGEQFGFGSRDQDIFGDDELAAEERNFAQHVSRRFPFGDPVHELAHFVGHDIGDKEVGEEDDIPVHIQSLGEDDVNFLRKVGIACFLQFFLQLFPKRLQVHLKLLLVVVFDQFAGDLFQISFHHPVEVVGGEVDPVVGNPVLGEVVGTDPL